ncbi:MAG: heme lyase CcmF/NrfE family subunit [Aggregatilineales bacterium]
MLAEIGIVTTGLALLCALFAVVTSLYGALNRRDRWIRSARNAALLTWPLLTTACICIIAGQVTHEYSIAYVWETTNNAAPLFFRLTALWGSQAGSLLFWAWVMSSFSCAVIALNWRAERRLMPWVLTFTMATLGFFLILVVFYENPFGRYWTINGADPVQAVFAPIGALLFTPADGKGLNPLLRHPGMIIHPPMLYTGFVGMTIPWAFAMAALASGQLNTNWIRSTRRWALAAWLFLSLGLILGGRWAYDVLGWGGYWGWDPVENSALLPWLATTAFLHSVMIQEKRGMLKVWNMFLVILSFLLVILGTFNTRSGLVASVHSFAQSPIGLPMFIFVVLAVSVSLGLWIWRWRRGDLRSEHKLDGLISRESLFILNNWVFMAITLLVAWGIYSPTFTQLLTGQQITLGTEYYRYFIVPLFGILYVLMGVAPLAAWKRASWKMLGKAMRPSLIATAVVVIALIVVGTTPGAVVAYGVVALAGFSTIVEYYRGTQARMKTHGENAIKALWTLFERNRRRYGGYLIHLGVVVIGIGIIGSTVFQQTTQQTVDPGQTITLGPYTLRYDNVFQATADDGRQMFIANVTVFRGGQEVATLRPRKDFFFDSHDPTTMTQSTSIAGNYSTLESDFYVLLNDWQGDRVTFKIYLNPLVNLVWWGGIVLILGTLIAAWPSAEREAAERRVEAARGAVTA